MRPALIIDDDKEMADAVRLLLRLLDFDAQCALSARDGVLHMMRSGVPDLLILDMSLPRVHGMEVLAYLRSAPRYRRLPIVILSTETYPDLVDKALAAGADAYVFKPATLEELEVAVKEALGKRG